MNRNLPVYEKKADFQNALRSHRVTVVPAETGAGKSTQLPQYVDELGLPLVVTQPRILAAHGVGKRVAHEMRHPFGGHVGYWTGEGKQMSDDTKILFCTDGLQLVREITGSGRAEVLMIDEVHEWNLNIEMLIAWCLQRMQEDAAFRLVLTSATMESQLLADFFAKVTGHVPVVPVPGRTFPVEWHHVKADELIPTIKMLVARRKNVLVFQPGKSEINQVMEQLKGLDAKVLPLYGELPLEQQNLVFEHYACPKVIVATNIAQTSITIDDIDASVDCGLERRTDLEDGVEGLYLRDISKADCRQRAGRAGRVKPGEYYLCSDTRFEDRPEYSVPEILRVRLDKLILTLAVSGLDAEKMEFFHQPDHTMLVESKRLCRLLGFLDQDGKITKLGRRASKLPVGVKVASMVLAGAKRGVLEDILTIAAIVETGSLKFRSRQNGELWRSLTSETESDLLAELDLYNVADSMLSRGEGKYLQDTGIFAKNFFKAKKLRQKIKDALRGLIEFRNGGNREDILKAIVAGFVDHLYHFVDVGRYGPVYTDDIEERQLARESVVKNPSPEWVVAQPFDIEIPLSGGNTKELELIQFVTAVTPEMLKEVAPHLVTTKEEPQRWSYELGCYVTPKVTVFDNQAIETQLVPMN